MKWGWTRQSWLQQVKSGRAQKEGPDLDRLLDVITKIRRARALTKREREWLLQLLYEILFDFDSRDRFHLPKRPGPQVAPGRDSECALWIACVSRPGRPDRMTMDDAKYEAQRVFGMTEAQVHRAWIKCGSSARRMAAWMIRGSANSGG